MRERVAGIKTVIDFTSVEDAVAIAVHTEWLQRKSARECSAQIEVDERFAAASRSWRSAASEPARSCGRMEKGTFSSAWL